MSNYKKNLKKKIDFPNRLK